MKAFVLAALLGISTAATAQTPFTTVGGTRFTVHERTVVHHQDRSTALVVIDGNGEKPLRTITTIYGCPSGAGRYEMVGSSGSLTSGVWTVGGDAVADNVAVHICRSGRSNGAPL